MSSRPTIESRRARKAASRLDRRARAAWGDISDPASIGAMLEGVDAVVHLAGIIPPNVDKAPFAYPSDSTVSWR